MIAWGADPNSRNFTLTGNVVSATGPVVLTAKNPPDDASQISIGKSLTATFSQPVEQGTTGNIQLWKTGDASPTETFAFDSARLIFGDTTNMLDTKTLTIDPTNPLDPNAEYYILIDNGAVMAADPSFGAFAGISDPTTWNFTTATPSALVFNAAGPATYSYSPTSSMGALPNAADLDAISTNIGVVRLVGAPAANTGIGLTDNVPGEIIWHFKTGPGLAFSNDVNLNVGASVSNAKVIADYSSDNSTWTNWGTTTNTNGVNFSPPNFTAANVADGKTDLYVRFRFENVISGGAVIANPTIVGATTTQRPFTLTGTVVATAQTYSSWIDGFFPGMTDPNIIGLNADPDNDGIVNGLENFFGTSPNQFSTGLTAGAFNSAAGTFTFSHPQGTLSGDLTAIYQWSTDLITFDPAGAAGGTTVAFETATASSVTTVTATATGTIPNKLFARVRVVQAAP
ncbi:MAG: Ig-like domain-containing protein [Akkermansiaceae bacterium]|nr:Ig-like domain-containing protein [Akkermansiaceae bacterium]